MTQAEERISFFIMIRHHTYWYLALSPMDVLPGSSRSDA